MLFDVTEEVLELDAKNEILTARVLSFEKTVKNLGEAPTVSPSINEGGAEKPYHLCGVPII